MSDSKVLKEKTASVAFFVTQKDEVKVISDSFTRLGYASEQVLLGGVKGALEWSKVHTVPDVLFVDLDGIKAPLVALEELFEVTGPSCKLIAVGSDQSIDLYRSLLSMGVFDYLVKPAPLDKIASMIEKAQSGKEENLAVGRTIAVTGSSGGLGVSLVAFALGKYLSSKRHLASALVDYDRKNGCLGLLLGMNACSGLDSVLNAEKIDTRLLERSINEIDERLSLISQPPNYRAAEIQEEDSVLLLGASLCRMFNQVVWDLPAYQPTGSLAVLQHSQTRIIVTDFTVLDARNTLRLLKEIGDETTGQRILLVRNATRQQNNEVITQKAFEDFVGRKVDLLLPYVGSGLGKSLLQGKMTLDAFPELTKGLLNLADLACGKQVTTYDLPRPTIANLLAKLLPSKRSQSFPLKGERL